VNIGGRREQKKKKNRLEKGEVGWGTESLGVGVLMEVKLDERKIVSDSTRVWKEWEYKKEIRTKRDDKKNT